MEHSVLIGLASVVVLGVLSQWVAWRLRIPSILLLLGAGILAGPVTGFLDPHELLGPALYAIVSLSVAVIMFEGGLSLKVHDLREVGAVFFRLATIGVAISCVLITLAARYVLGFAWTTAAVMGAVMVVTGPTVIIPMLRHLRLSRQVGAILRWEGIVVDPIGAMLGVAVFAVARSQELQQGAARAISHLVLTLLVGAGIGWVGAILLRWPLRRYWIPDSLHNAVALAAVFAVFAGSNQIEPESGLLAVTVMGIAIANQKLIAVKHLVEFKENLSLLLLAYLFIILAALLKPADLRDVGLEHLIFLAILVLVVRPASVFCSTVGSNLNFRERLFLCWMAPRGIVAVAVMSLLSLELMELGDPQAARLAPTTFVVVFGTVMLYGLTAPTLARRLGLARPNPQGVLFAGAHAWARALAEALQSERVPVLLVDTDWDNVCYARMAGLPAHYGSILAEQTINEIDFSELGRLVAVTANNEVNSLACLRFVEIFGRREVYQLPFTQATQGRHEAVSLEQRGRFLLDPALSNASLGELFEWRPKVKKTRLTPEFDFEAFRKMHGQAAIPVFLLTDAGKLTVFAADEPWKPQPGVLFSVMRDDIAPPAQPDTTETAEKSRELL